ncbi:MAG: hypothetical protein ACMUHU_04175 [Thermoplasmatota archaeon]
MGHELLFRLGDDPLAELAEMDDYYQWSARIRKLRLLFERKSSLRRWLPGALVFLLIVLGGALVGTFVYLAFF